MNIDTIKQTLGGLLDRLVSLGYSNPSPKGQAIYNAAKAALDTHITLDPSVSPELGCAEAVSYILKAAGVPDLPQEGIPGTAALYSYLQSSTRFVGVNMPLPGDIIICPTGTSSKGSPHGHTGIVAKYGILSNDSNTGLFKENYNLTTWNKYFGGIEGFPIYCFRWV